MFVGKGRVCPADASATVQLAAGRLNEFGSADDVKAFGRQSGDEQFASLVEHPDLIVIPDKMNGAPAGLRNGRKVFPDAVAGIGLETPQLAVTVDTIDVITEENWGGDEGV